MLFTKIQASILSSVDWIAFHFQYKLMNDPETRFSYVTYAANKLGVSREAERKNNAI